MKGIEKIGYNLDDYNSVEELHENFNYKIRIYMRLSKDIFPLLVGNGKKKEIELGEYPQEEANPEIASELEGIYNHSPAYIKSFKSLEETGRKYTIIQNKKRTTTGLTIPDFDMLDVNLLWFLSSFYGTKTFVEQIRETHLEYKYKNEKYIRMKVDNEVKWLKVSPITWIIDKENRTITTKYPLVETLYCNEKAYGCFEKSREKTEKYINEQVLRNILQTFHLTKTIKYQDYDELISLIQLNSNINDYKELVEIEFVGPSLTEEEQLNIKKYFNENEKITFKIAEKSDPKDIINSIVNKIYKILDLNIYDNKEEIINRINTLIEKYNEDIEKSFNKTKLPLQLDNLSEEYLYNRLISDLEDILNELKVKSDKYKEHFIMLDLINNCLNILESEKKPNNDLEQDIYTIKNSILPILEKEDKLKELKNIFIKEKESITSYINGDENSKASNYKTLDDFIISIRKELQPYLISLNKEISDKDTVKEIQESYLNLASGENIKSKDEYIKFILEEIEKNIEIIKENGTEEEQDKLKELLLKKEEKDNDILTSVSKISSIFTETYKIVLDIKEREMKENKKESYKVTINHK